MKRKIISWLLAVACCLSLLPGNLVIAEESGGTYPSTTTIAYFTNQSQLPESADYAQAITVTGAALTKATEVGGKTRWDFGMIIIEPNDGYTFEKAWYSSNSQELTVATVQDILNKWGQAIKIPSKIENAINSKLQCKAIEIDSVLHNEIKFNTISLDFKNSSGNIISQKVYIQSNEIWANDVNLKINENFDLFSDKILGATIKKFKGNNYSKENFEIRSYQNTGSGNNNNQNLEKHQDGTYSISKTGNYEFILNDIETGIRYMVSIGVILGENAPLKKENINVSENVLINDKELSKGIIEIQPASSEEYLEYLVKNVKISFTNLPEGATIKWNTVKVNNRNFPLELNKETSFSKGLWQNKENKDEEVLVNFLVTEENGEQNLLISSNGGLNSDIDFDIQYGNENYTYSISFKPRYFLDFMGGQTFYLNTSSDDADNKSIFDFLSAHGSDKNKIEQKFIEKIQNGIYNLTISGVNYLMPDGGICFRYPSNAGLRIYDKEIMAYIQGWNMNVSVYRDAYVPYGTPYNLKEELLNNYWEDSYDVKLTEGITYNSESKSITATKNGNIEILNKGIVVAQFGITVYDNNNYEENLKAAISNLPKTGGSSIIMNGRVLTADILKALKESSSMSENGKGNHLIIVLKTDSGNRVEWSFNSAIMNNIADKDIRLDINVGNGVENKEFDKVMEENNIEGLKLGFYDNGELPGEVQIRLYLSDEEINMLTGNSGRRMFAKDSNINLYYFNPDKKIVKEKNNLYINNDTLRNQRYISIPIKHNSDFLLSTKDLDNNSTSGTISGGGVSVVYTPTPTTAPTATPVATSTVAPTIAPTVTPVATSTPVSTTAPVATSTPAPTAVPTATPSETEIPDATPTVAPSVKNQIKKIKATKKKVTVKKDKKLDVNFKIVATDNKKAVKDKAKATIKNKKIAKVVKTKVKAGKAVVTVKGKIKGKTVLKLNIGGKIAKTTIRVK